MSAEVRPRPYADTVAVLTTMHGKERAIAPILQEHLGLVVGLALGVDTDRFGTFSREIERKGSQLDAARAKIAAGFDYAPLARVGLASEGGFGPHPQMPFLPLARELVLLVDRERDLEIAGWDVGPQTNFRSLVATRIEDVLAFASAVGFPSHGVTVTGVRGRQPAPDLMLDKAIADETGLVAAAERAIAGFGAAFVETDMRAHRNPTRMSAIGRAATDLVRRYLSACPACGRPGYDIVERARGLACAGCGLPTSVIEFERLACAGCGHHQLRRPTERALADPGECARCNP